MKHVVSVLIMLGVLSALPAEKDPSADMIIVNANIITLNSKQPRAEAVAILNGKVLAVGSKSMVEKTKGSHTIVLDAKGQTIVPGFNDAHLHPSPIYPFESVHSTIDLGPSSVKTMDDLVALLKRKAALTPDGLPVRGFGYQDTKLGGHPTRELLDKVSTRHPVIIRHSSGHIVAVNSYVLKLAGINERTVDPAGGAFDRDAAGFPNGVCRESALSDFFKSSKMKVPDPPSEAEEREAFGKCFDRYLANGITSITEAGSSFPRYDLYKKLQSDGMGLRINLLISENYLDEVIARGIRKGYGNQNLKISGIKVFHGNSLTGRTCWLTEPYDMINPETGKKDYYGIPPKRSQSQLDSLFIQIHSHGLQIGCHSNGDREIAMVLESIEKAQLIHPAQGMRHRIEHCSVTTEELLKRIAKDSLVVVLHSYIYEHGDKMLVYGAKRWPMMFPDKTATANGIHVAQHSDDPISSAIPLLRIQSLVTRTSAEGIVIGENQRISVEDAIREWCTGGAYASFDDVDKGTIESGRFADLVLLAEDPTKTDVNKIKDIKVNQTMINGKFVYDRNALARQ